MDAIRDHVLHLSSHANIFATPKTSLYDSLVSVSVKVILIARLLMKYANQSIRLLSDDTLALK